MKIDKKTVDKIAKLSKLKFNKEEGDLILNDMNKMLDFIDLSYIELSYIDLSYIDAPTFSFCFVQRRCPRAYVFFSFWRLCLLVSHARGACVV